MNVEITQYAMQNLCYLFFRDLQRIILSKRRIQPLLTFPSSKLF